MDDDLEVSVARSKNSISLTVGGDIDLPTLERFDRAMRDAIHESREVVNLDLSEVTFLASVGLRSMVSARKLAAEEGVRLRIVNQSERVQRILELTGLAVYFN